MLLSAYGEMADAPGYRPGLERALPIVDECGTKIVAPEEMGMRQALVPGRNYSRMKDEGISLNS